MRKEYTKPTIERVELKAEEAVLSGCKTLGAGSGVWQGAGYCNHSGSGWEACYTAAS